MLAWIHTAGVGDAATMPDSRTAYVELRRPGLWRLRIVKKPGRGGMADYYSPLKSSPDACRQIAEEMAERIRARAQRGAKHAA